MSLKTGRFESTRSKSHEATTLDLMSLLRPGAKDPRHIVTPDAFGVAPELLGRPLASPWRRGVALLADLLFVFLLTRLGSVSASLAATVIFLILVWRKTIERRWLRWTVRALATAASLVIFLVIVIALEVWSPGPTHFSMRFGSNDDTGAEAAGYTGMTGEQWAQLGQAAASQDPEAQAKALQGLVEELIESGAAEEQVRPLIDAFDLSPEVEIGLEDLLGVELSGSGPEPEIPPLDPAEVASLLEGYAGALRGGDEAKIAELGTEVEELLSAQPTARLKRQVERLRRHSRELTRENLELRDQVENPSFMRSVSAFSADLGLTFGWSGLYFSFFLAWWRGRTPGKWLFSLRVVSLDDRTLGLWRSFERFAGYAAGVATGLFGFLQIFWDPNRQGIQDKIVGTVVLAEPRTAKSASMAPGRA